MVKLSALLSSVALTDVQVCEMGEVIENYLNVRLRVGREFDGVEDATEDEEMDTSPVVRGRTEHVLKPKHIVLLEYPSLIRSLGPLSFYATYSAESKNGEMKQYLRDHGSFAYPLSSLKTHVEAEENKDVLGGEAFEYRFMDEPFKNLGCDALAALEERFGGQGPVASRCHHFTLNGSKYTCGSVLAYNEATDVSCVTFALGQVVALWGDDEESAGFLVKKLKRRLDETYMAISVEEEDRYEVVFPNQLCCHEPFQAMCVPSIGLMCALACAPTVFSRLEDML